MMRPLAVLLVILAAIAFIVGALSAFGVGAVLGRAPVTYWRGAVGFLLFAITLLLMERRRA